MPKSEFPALLEHIGYLLTERCWETVLLHVRRALSLAQTGMQTGQLLQLGLQVPAEVRSAPAWAPLMAFIAFRADDPQACEAHLRGQPQGLEALSAWVLMRCGEYEAALDASEKARSGEFADVAWRMRAWAMAALNQAGWAEAFREAVQHNKGRQRGLCLLQLGAYLTLSGSDAEARSAYAEAAPYFAGDPHLRSNACYNVGTACLRLQQLDHAERAYREAMIWARKPEGIRMLARAWCGLGHVYRARQEFPRAIHAYDVAQTKATEQDDVAQAWRGKAHTLRLVGRLDEALTTLYEGLTLLGCPEIHPLYADVGATQLMLGDEQGVERSLACVPEAPVEETQRTAVIRAEMARRAGQIEAARTLMHSVTLDALWANEEAQMFPEVFALVGLCPTPPHPMQVQVSADGPVSVRLNGQQLALRATSAAASLLVFLCWQEGRADVEQALEGLQFRGDTPRRKRQNLSRAVTELRDALGWPLSVQTDGRTLWLDPQVTWAPLELPSLDRAEVFCAGLYDSWAQDWREMHLRPLDA